MRHLTRVRPYPNAKKAKYAVPTRVRLTLNLRYAGSMSKGRRQRVEKQLLAAVDYLAGHGWFPTARPRLDGWDAYVRFCNLDMRVWAREEAKENGD